MLCQDRAVLTDKLIGINRCTIMLIDQYYYIIIAIPLRKYLTKIESLKVRDEIYPNVKTKTAQKQTKECENSTYSDDNIYSISNNTKKT